MNRLVTIAAAAAIALTVSACSVNPQDAYRTLEAQGFTQIELLGYPFMGWGCADGDTFKTEFKAVGVNGKPIKGVLCSSAFKGVTVRITG